MSKTIKDLTGQKFGKLTAIKPTEERINKKIVWLCKCDCGNECKIVGVSLTSGNSKSCGCITKKHGMFGTRIYGVWRGMKERCYVPNCISYPNYGGRGISVCDEWQKFKPFMEWAYANGYDENAPRGQCTLDRIDPNGDYCPENCRWVGFDVQSNNKNTNVFIEYNGKIDTLTNHARNLGINPTLAEGRMIKGKSIEEIFSKEKLNKAKKIIQYDKNGNFINIWDSCKDASEGTGININTIRVNLSGHTKTCHRKYIFNYIDEEG